MSIDNSTGKTKGFYERGQTIFDRIPGMPEEKNMKQNSRRRTLEWIGLTGVEINHIFAANVGYPERMMQEVEAKLKEKNGG